MAETPYRRFQKHRVLAAHRGIDFILTFEEWLKIWTDSGQLYNAGRNKGQYHMARRGDKGPYAVGNVRIITAEDNHSEMRHSEAHKKYMSKIGRNRTHSEETKAKIRAANSGDKNPNFGKKMSAEARINMSKARLGNKNSLGHKQTAEHKAKALANRMRARAARQELQT